MNKTVLQLTSFSAMTETRRAEAPIIMMSLTYNPGVLSEEKRGLLVHFISPGRKPIDFLCYSCCIVDPPSNIKLGKMLRIIQQQLSANIFPADEPSPIIKGHFYGLTLPAFNEADELLIDFFKDKEVAP